MAVNTMIREKVQNYAEQFLDFVNPDRWDGDGEMPESVRPERDFCVTFDNEWEYMLLWLEEDNFGWWVSCRVEGCYTQNGTQDIGNVDAIADIIAATLNV